MAQNEPTYRRVRATPSGTSYPSGSAESRRGTSYPKKKKKKKYGMEAPAKRREAKYGT